jgi:hypothetical protein
LPGMGLILQFRAIPTLRRLHDAHQSLPARMNVNVLISDERGEVFTLTLARDAGARLMTPSPWLPYIVHTDIPADVVADYNAWYDEEHLPRLVGVPGVERARRFVADGQRSLRYLTAYDLSIRDAFESSEGLRARKTPWTERMRSLFKNTRRKCVRSKGDDPHRREAALRQPSGALLAVMA